MHEVAVKNRLGEVKFSLEESGWVQKYSDYLEDGRITLLNGGSLSVDTAGHQWVMFYRTYNRMNDPSGYDGSVKMLCIGWQDNIGGRNVKALNWVYPNGFIELAEEPEFWMHFLM